MSKEKKSSKFKSLIGNLLGIKEWKLKDNGHLDIKEENLIMMRETYGEEFVKKFEQLLADEKEGTKQIKSDMLKLELLCALLGVQAITMSEDGKNATLSEEQLGKIETGLRKLTDEKTAADSNLATANTDKDVAVAALAAADKALDELNPKVKEVKTTKEKVEAVRVLLAAKPGVAVTGALRSTDPHKQNIEGADPINAKANELIN
jgi:hypothetical protein